MQKAPARVPAKVSTGRGSRVGGDKRIQSAVRVPGGGQGGGIRVFGGRCGHVVDDHDLEQPVALRVGEEGAAALAEGVTRQRGEREGEARHELN
eukprot:6750059-Prymnesium_polylepis.1